MPRKPKVYPNMAAALVSSAVKRTGKLVEQARKEEAAKRKKARAKKPVHISDVKLMMAFAELNLLEERRKALRNIIHQLTKE